MGTSGLVGPIMTFQAMQGAESAPLIILKIIAVDVIFPAVLAYVFYAALRARGLIRDGDMKLDA